MTSHIKRVVSSKDGLIRWVVSQQGSLSFEGGTSVSSDGLSHRGSLFIRADASQDGLSLTLGLGWSLFRVVSHLALYCTRTRNRSAGISRCGSMHTSTHLSQLKYPVLCKLPQQFLSFQMNKLSCSARINRHKSKLIQ